MDAELAKIEQPIDFPKESVDVLKSRADNKDLLWFVPELARNAVSKHKVPTPASQTDCI